MFIILRKKKTLLRFFVSNVQKVHKMFGIMKKTTKMFTKSEQKTIRHNFFNFREVRLTYTPVFVGDFVPHIHRTHTSLAEAPRPWMKNNWLVNVSTYEFSTFVCSDFDKNLTGVFFHDSNYFLTFYLPAKKKKNYVRNFYN